MHEPGQALKPDYDQDAAGGPTHQPSVQPGAAHLPVRGQPTGFSGELVQVLPRIAGGSKRPAIAPGSAVSASNSQPHSMTRADVHGRWLRFSQRLAAALKNDGRDLGRQGVRLQLQMVACVRQSDGVVLNASVRLLRNGLSECSVAGLHVTQLPDRWHERSLTELASEVTAAAQAWLQKPPPLGVLPVFAYP